ncbi:MAG TPA: alkene reductase [Burkholderiaceae bacterium]|nr:alkene reductase [Burkholderiaceae bacterium]
MTDPVAPRSAAPLLSPIRIGALDCPNRVLMAPLTRCRADAATLAPTALNAEYYAQRASAGLIVSEATQVRPDGMGYQRTPGMYSDAQRDGWRLVTDAVHEAGGRIVAQLWHVGAVSHPDLQPGGALPVSSSPYNPGGVTHTPAGKQPQVAARALRTDEIPAIVEAYRHSSRLARDAGFDGVEIHSANGYLLEQFIRDSVNRRDDAYGGSIANRLRLVLEVVDAAVGVWGADRVGIRLAPVTGANGCPQDGDPQATYGALVEALDARGLAYLHFIEGNTGVERHARGFDFGWARRAFRGTYVANNRYGRDEAIESIASGAADAVAFGVPFISNPDLPRRLELGVPLAPANTKTFYSQGPAGYVDYPALEAA